MANENKPLVPAKPGDPITAGRWNDMQTQLREEHILHTHTGVWNDGRFDGEKIGTVGLADKAVTGAKVDPTTALEVRTLTATGLAVREASKLGSLDVTGAATLHRLTVSDATTLASLDISGAATLQRLTVRDATTLASLDISGAATFKRGLTVSEAAKTGSLEVTGAAKAGSLEVTGTTTLGSLDISGAATFKRGLTVTGAAKAGSLEVTGAAALGSLKVNGVAFRATQVFNNQAGPLPIAGNVTISGGTLLLFFSGSGRSAVAEKKLGISVWLADTQRGVAHFWTNVGDKHTPFVAHTVVVTGVPAGTHKVELKAEDGTITDGLDFFTVTVLEIPS